MTTHPSSNVPTSLRPFLPTNIQTHLSSFPVTYLPSYLHTYLHTYLPKLGLFLLYLTLPFLVLIEVRFGMSWSLFQSVLVPTEVRSGPFQYSQKSVSAHFSPFLSVSVSRDTPSDLVQGILFPVFREQLTWAIYHWFNYLNRHNVAIKVCAKEINNFNLLKE